MRKEKKKIKDEIMEMSEQIENIEDEIINMLEERFR